MAKQKDLWPSVCLVFAVALILCMPGVVNPQPRDFDPLNNEGGRPYVQYDFTTVVAARSLDCFHQYAKKDSKFTVDFEVLDTAGKAYTIDFQVKNPNGVIIKSLKNVEDGVYTGQTVEEGVYTVCLDNGYSRFTAKIVYLEISVFQRGEWKQYLADKMKREEDQEEIEDGMYDRLDVISENLDDVLQGQAFGRRNAIRDWYLSQSNNLYVQRWSITQCIVIVAASFCQAFFVRRMFRVSNVTPNQKPRA